MPRRDFIQLGLGGLLGAGFGDLLRLEAASATPAKAGPGKAASGLAGASDCSEIRCSASCRRQRPMVTSTKLT